MYSFFLKLFFISIILFSCLLNFEVKGQTINEINKDTLNQLDAKKRKIGYWIEYLNDQLYPSAKKEDDVFFRYIYYDHGEPVGIVIPGAMRRLILVVEGNSFKTGEIILLNGTYSFYSKNYDLLRKEIYINGIPVQFLSYRKNKIKEEINFNKKYNNQTGSYLTISYNKDGSEKEKFYFGKKDDKWQVIQEIGDDGKQKDEDVK
jgi:hypothetical protein